MIFVKKKKTTELRASYESQQLQGRRNMERRKTERKEGRKREREKERERKKERKF